MRVLQVNKFLFQRGGAERYLFEVTGLLRRHGHEVSHFAMAHPANVDSPDAEYFVSNIRFRDTTAAYRVRNVARIVSKTVYSREARRQMRRLLRDRRPDLAHVHMVSHQISPSILDELKAQGIPIVQTLHEYKLVCPSYHLYLHERGQICERCLGGNYLHAIRQRCVKGSLAGSTLAAAAQYVHRFLGVYTDNVDLFLAPSRFLADKLVAGGLPAAKIRVLQLYLDLDGYRPRFEPGESVLYFGRLSPEKGLGTLLEAMALLPEIDLVVVGEGPEEDRLRARIARDGITNVRLAGYKAGEELKELVRASRLVVVPSEWYENSPLVIYEANALGKPVVASRIGGIPECIEDGVTGLLFPAGDVEQLAEAIHSTHGDQARCEEMGRAARARVERVCTEHHDGLMAAYAEAAGR